MVHLTVSAQTRKDLLTAALEGGSHWYFIAKEAMDIINAELEPDGELTLADRMWTALDAGEYIPVHNIETKEKVGEISWKSMEEGEQILAVKYPKHLADLINENEDATTADIWFQLAVMGDVVYG